MQIGTAKYGVRDDGGTGAAPQPLMDFMGLALKESLPMLIDKAVRVQHYVDNILHDVGVIAHSCGVKHPRQLKRRHARIVTRDGSSIGLHIRHPETEEGYPHGRPTE